jgi:hypothetical protein
MNLTYLYQLDAKGKKVICPVCGDKSKTWRRYINTKTGELLPERYGICDRIIKCQHKFTPFDGGEYGGVWQDKFQDRGSPSPLHPEPHETERINVPDDLLKPLWMNWRHSTFVQNLEKQTNNRQRLQYIAHRYGLGAIRDGAYAGAVVFCFIDHKINVRYAQVKLFDDHNHTTKTTALHTITKAPEWREWAKSYNNQYSKQDCFFGAHLLTAYPDLPVFVVEAPKTAIIATLTLGVPEELGALWIATGGAGMLTISRSEPLRGRNVVLVPDTDANFVWEQKAWEIARFLNNSTPIKTKIKVSTMLKDRRTKLGPKADLADLIVLPD